MNNYGIYAIGAALVDTELQVSDDDLGGWPLTRES